MVCWLGVRQDESGKWKLIGRWSDWPSGTKVYFAHALQLWEEFGTGRLPAFIKGVNLVRLSDDGSDAWRSLYERACEGPVYGEG